MNLKQVNSWGPEIEKKITEKWKNAELFKFDKNSKKPIYSIDTPPPYINAPIHIGQAVTYCYMDMFARYKRMKGFQVIFPLGLDRNGLPIEVGAEKKFGISAFKLSRKEFLEYCHKLLEETSNETQDTFSKLGISFTSYKKANHIGSIYFTDSPEYRAMTQSTFIDLYNKGLIYESTKVSNWDPKLQTTIADSEIEYKNIDSSFVYVKWKIKGSGKEIIIATTRPELICTCGMVIFNPGDKRYKDLEGKIAISPIFKKEIPIKGHPMADPEKGTGIAMMCSAGDLSDIQFFREQKIKLIIAINKDGTMNEHSGFLKGLRVKDAREKIINSLKKEGLVLKEQKISHRTPVSERSGAEIEFIEMPEFYLKQLEFKDKIKEIAKKIKFYPETSKKILNDWVDSITLDWPISRRRFYATDIPLWYSEENGEKLIAVPKPGEYYQTWRQDVPDDADVWKNEKLTNKKVKDFKTLKWKGEERVFDTWMDSSISELFILNYKSDPNFFKRTYPATLRPQGKEIVRTWLYYTLLRGYLETGKPCFRDVWIHQHILDENSKKMSKSLGNVINPQELLREYGAEAIRFWSVIEGDLSKQDLSCSKDKIKSELKTLTKLLNVSKFVALFEKPKNKPTLTNLDKLFIDYVEDMASRFDKMYNNYDFYHPSLELRRFLWEIFASHYIELVKARVYNQEKKFSKEESDSARYTLNSLLDMFLTLVYPIIPQISSFIANERGFNLLNCEYPLSRKGNSNLKLVDEVIKFNSKVWKTKKEKEISLRGEIKDIEIPKELKSFEQDLIATHNII